MMDPITVVSLTFGILAAAPRVVELIDNIKYAIASKEETRELGRHLSSLYNTLAEMESMTNRLRYIVPRRLSGIIQALGDYCRDLGGNIYSFYRRYRRNRAYRFLTRIAMAGKFDRIRIYRDRLEDCENWYNIALKTLHLIVNQEVRSHSPSSLRGQVSAQDRLRESDERRCRNELRQYLGRIKRAKRYQSRRYRHLERAGINLHILKKFATEALHEPATRSISSTASFPKPRPRPHGSPKLQPQYRQPQQTAQSNYHTQVPVLHHIDETDPLAYREPRARPQAPHAPTMARNNGHSDSPHQTRPHPAASSYMSTRTPSSMPMAQPSTRHVPPIDQRDISRGFLEHYQQIPTSHGSIHTATPQQTRIIPHEGSVNYSTLPSSDNDSFYEEPALHYQHVEPPRIVETIRPQPPNHQSRDDRSSHHRSAHRSRSTGQGANVEQDLPRPRRSDVSEMYSPSGSYHSKHDYTSADRSTLRYQETNVRKMTRDPTNFLTNHNPDSEEASTPPARLDVNPAKWPSNSNERHYHRPAGSRSSSGDGNTDFVTESFVRGRSNTRSSSGHTASNVMSESPGPRRAHLNENSYPPITYDTRTSSSLLSDSGYVSETPHIRTSVPDSPQVRIPDVIDRSRPPIAYNNAHKKRGRRRRSRSKSSSRSLDSGFVDASSGNESSDEMNRSQAGSRRSSAETNESYHSRESGQPLQTVRAEDYSREKRSHRRSGSSRL